MAFYTGMSNLQNHPHRSGFDIGRKNAFTAKVGELLPVYWDISMPGDKYKFNVEYFTRTQPVETSAYTRLREYFDFYAVPLRLLWKSAPSVLTQMQDVNQIQALSLTQNLCLQLLLFVLIWKLLIVSPAYTVFSSELRSLFEHIQQTDVQNFSGPAALLEESSLDEKGSCVLSPGK
jgi:hypothetical protein